PVVLLVAVRRDPALEVELEGEVESVAAGIHPRPRVRVRGRRVGDPAPTTASATIWLSGGRRAGGAHHQPEDSAQHGTGGEQWPCLPAPRPVRRSRRPPRGRRHRSHIAVGGQPSRIGSLRIGLPVRRATALATAGAMGGTPGSPTPPSLSPTLPCTIWVSTAGMSRIRMTG